MKKAITISAALVVFSLPLAQAFAAPGFFVEIGAQDTVDATKAKWEELSAKHKTLLGKLTFYPKTVINADGSSAAIIQAGPIDDKNKAQRLCNKLFAKDVPCFVIEGVEKTPPTVSIGMSRALFSVAANKAPLAVDAAPQVAAAAPASAPEAPAEEKKPAVLGQISAPSAPAGEAKVAVAEAIPVPLSSEKAETKVEVVKAAPVPPAASAHVLTVPDKKPETAAAPATLVAPTPAAPVLKAPNVVVTSELAPIEYTDGEAGWLTVGSFADQKAANGFWQAVSTHSPELTAGLRVRVLRPLLSRNTNNAVRLNVGPFPSNAAADHFCAQAVTTFNPQLTCSFEGVANAPVRSDVESLPVKIDQSDRYEQRRKRLEQQRKTGEKTDMRGDGASVAGDEAGKKYWAQVVMADSKAEAQSRLQDITTANADVLSGISGRISSNPTRKSKFTVRLGPLTGESAANELCDTLQTRGLDCLVVGTK